MKRIFKYPIPIEDDFIIELPLGSKILTIQMQKSQPFIWVLANPNNDKINRYFYLYGTGMEIEKGSNYIGSFQMLNGDLVYHLFEE